MNYTSEQGKITLGNSVFARIVTECGARFSRRMIFSTPKGRPIRAGKTGREALGFIGVEYVEAMNAVNYKVYVIVRFGVSMSTLFGQVASAIRKETKYVTGCDVSRVHFFVTGVKSKNLVRRDLEFIY
mgnify:CR=1 FL=1